MALVPADLLYSQSHEWVKLDGNIATIGITDHAQAELGDITYLDLPEVGRMLQKDSQFGEVESVKAVSELFAPLTGEVIETNTGISDTTELVNSDPYGEGWLIKVTVSNSFELSVLLEAADYEKFSEEDGGGH